MLWLSVWLAASHRKQSRHEGKREGKSMPLDLWKAETIRSTRKIALLIKARIAPPRTSASLSHCFAVSRSHAAESSTASLSQSWLLTWTKISH